MNLDNNILAVVEPAIMPTAIEIEGLGEAEEDGGADRQTKAIGVDLPFVLLNNYQFMQKDIQSFSLDNSGFLPEMRIRLVDRKNTFGVDSFPRDGDVITIDAELNTINVDLTNEELAEVNERNSIDMHIGHLNVLQQDVSKVLTELLPKVKKVRKK